MFRHLSAVIAVIILLAGAASAEAGFMMADLGDVLGELAASPHAVQSSAANEDSQPSPQSPAGDELIDHHSAALPTGGMTSGNVSSFHLTTAAQGVLAEPVDVSAQLVSWLSPERSIWLPPPFSSGVFRPPRC